MKSLSMLALLVAALFVVLSLAATPTAASALSQPQPLRSSVYNRSSLPHGWSRISSASSSSFLTFTLVLRPDAAKDAAMEELFWQVSDPKHANYGNFLSQLQLVDMARISPTDRAKLMTELASHGISESDIVLDAGDSLRIRTSVKKATSLFNTKFYNFQHRKSGVTAIRQWGACSLPASIKEMIELVLDIHTFPTVEQRMQHKSQIKQRRAMEEAKRTSAKINGAPGAPLPAYVPQTMAAIYGVPLGLVPGSNSTVTTGVVEFSSQTFSVADLMQFSNLTSIPLIPPTAAHIIGNNTEAPEGTEAALDIQWLQGVNPALEPWFWLESDPHVWMYTFTVDFLAASEFPMILSVSYGLPEVLQCDYFYPSDCNGLSYEQYVLAVDRQFRKIGLLGVSLIVCSQDRGVMVDGPPPAPLTPFNPEYPGTSVYATAVGATEIRKPVYKLPSPPPICQTVGWECVSGGDEAAVSFAVAGYLSGGGFSNVTTQPDYQSAAVKRYFNSGVSLPNSTVYNATGRGFPDISAIGTNGFVVVQTRDTLVGGTSMSTPIIAAIFSMLQAEYMAITNKTLGFLNPLLYQAAVDMPSVYTDIVVGDNCVTTACANPGVQDGFYTAKGWDPVTGLGTPVYSAWSSYIQKHARQVNAKAIKSAKY